MNILYIITNMFNPSYDLLTIDLMLVVSSTVDREKMDANHLTNVKVSGRYCVVFATRATT
jgi:hypothetical protein